jgi:hypothetical protein
VRSARSSRGYLTTGLQFVSVEIFARWLSDVRISFVINLCSTGDRHQPLTVLNRKQTHDHSVSFRVVTPETMVILPDLFLRMMLPEVDDAKMQSL